MKITKEKRKSSLADFVKNRSKGGNFVFITKSDDDLEQYGVKRFKTDPGPIFIAILPREDSELFFYELFVHRGLADKKDFLCPQRMFNEACPACQLADELESAGDSDGAGPYYPGRQYLMWVLNMDNPRTLAEGPHLYQAPKSVLDGIFEVCVDVRTGETLDVSDPDERINVVFKRTGKGINTRYVGFKLEDREEDIPKEFFDLPPMSDMIIMPDVNQMRQVIGAKNNEPKEEEAPPERVNRTKGEKAVDRGKRTLRGVATRGEEEAPAEPEDEPKTTSRFKRLPRRR